MIACATVEGGGCRLRVVLFGEVVEAARALRWSAETGNCASMVVNFFTSKS